MRQMAGMPKRTKAEWALRRWTSLNVRAVNRALEFDSVADRYDSYAAKKLGTPVVPRRRGY